MDSLDPIEALPRFPPELERPIFTLVAEYCPETLPALLLVARRAYEWLEPFRYSTLRLREKISPKFLSMLRQKGPSFLAVHVSRIILDRESQDGNEIFAQCVGAKEVVLEDGSRSLFSKLVQYSRLRKLSLGRPSSSLSFFLYQLNINLPSLTHLEYNASRIPNAEILERYCPNLSHFMIYDWLFPIKRLSDILKLSQIRLVVVILQPRKSDSADLFKHEKLIKILPDRNATEEYRRRDWIEEIQDRNDYWKRAEQMLQTQTSL